jgi:hypothetical protein
LGEDWVAPKSIVDLEMRDRRERRNVVALNRSPLARKIITFNLLAHRDPRGGRALPQPVPRQPGVAARTGACKRSRS